MCASPFDYVHRSSLLREPTALLSTCRSIINAGEPRYRHDLQLAVDDACRKGGIVFLPPLDDPDDSYVVARPPLVIRRPDIAILGGGIHSRVTLNPQAPTEGQVLEIQEGIEINASGDGNVVLGSFWLDFSVAAPQAPPLLVTGISVSPGNTAPLFIRDVSIKPRRFTPTPPLVVGIALSGTAHITLDSVNLFRCQSYGLYGYFHQQTSGRRPIVRLLNCSVAGGGTGAYFDGHSTVDVYCSAFGDNQWNGLVLVSVDQASVLDCRFENNYLDGDACNDGWRRAQLLFDGTCESVRVDGCYLRGHRVDGVDLVYRAGVGIHVANRGMTSLTRNVIDGHSCADIYITRAAGTVFPAVEIVDGRPAMKLNAPFVGPALSLEVRDERLEGGV